MMYIHAERGKYFVGHYDGDEYANDRYIAGELGLLDRAAIARVSTPESDLGPQSIVITVTLILVHLLLCIVAFTLLGYWGLPYLFLGSLLVTLFSINESIDVQFSTVSKPTITLRLSEARLARQDVAARTYRVGESTALRYLVGDGYAGTNAIGRWLRDHEDYKSIIDSLLLDKWVRETDATLAALPSDLDKEARQVAEELRQQLALRVKETSDEIAKLDAAKHNQATLQAKQLVEERMKDVMQRLEEAPAAPTGQWQQPSTDKIAIVDPNLR